jgi:peptidyl-prolyl cis-trans isomerase SurA
MSTVDIHEGSFEKTELWAFSDSVFDNKISPVPLHLTATTPVLLMKDRKFTVTDWVAYGQVYRYRQDGSGIKSYPDLWNEFVQAKALEYYEDHLEDFNEPFRQQVNEFRDGNLFFEIMQRKVWGPAQSDSAALATYFEANQSKYKWGLSADAVVFYATDAVAANRFRTELVKNPKDWRALSGKFSETIAADSSRFDLSQLQIKGPVKAGQVTAVRTNVADHTQSIIYVIRTYSQSGNRSLSEARGLVINDYQADLEKRWLEELRARYPVKINQPVWNGLKGKY